MNPPELTIGCRAYRKFRGEDRFLTIKVPSKFVPWQKPLQGNMVCGASSAPPEDSESESKRRARIMEINAFLGREYRLLNTGRWTFDDSKASYLSCVYFAESGDGLQPFGVDAFIDWHLQPKNPRNLNLNAAKLLSRISLAFSTTHAICQLKPEEWKVIPDKRSGGNVLTDGCGLISRSLIDLVNQKLESKHSIVQGRFGSAKGTWIVHESLDVMKLKLCVRESQLKYFLDHPDSFQSTFEVLESHRQIDMSRSAGLNCDMIWSLNECGIQESTLKALLEESLRWKDLEKLERKSCFRWIKHKNSCPEDTDSELKMISSMLLGGISMNDPFLVRMLNRTVQNTASSTARKIRLELEESRYLMIAADPYQVLKPGECFVQLTDCSSPILFDSEIIAARNPIKMPEHWIKAKNTYYHQLSKVFNVLILSTSGTFAPAMQMNGGDYDGDIALVVWDQRIVRELKPMQFFDESSIKKDLENLIQKREEKASEIENWISFAFSLRDCERFIGQVDRRHKLYADKYGLTHCISRELAVLSCMLIDGKKNGISLEQTRFFQFFSGPLQECSKIPHWLAESKSKQNQNGSSFHSESIVGRLYDFIQKKGCDFLIPSEFSVDPDLCLERHILERDELDDIQQFFACALELERMERSKKIEKLCQELNLSLEEFAKIGYELGMRRRAMHILESVWKLFGDHLCQIKSGKESLRSPGKWMSERVSRRPPAMSPEMFGYLTSTKRRKYTKT